MSEEVVYHHPPKTDDYGETTTATEPEAVEKSDRGLFDHFSKKEEDNKCEDSAISSEFHEKVHVSESEPKHEEKKEGFLQKLHRSGSSSSSSSEEEYEEDGEKKRRKKPLKEKIKEKFEKNDEDDTCVPVEKYEEAPAPEVVHPTPTTEPEEKKGFLDKIKEKLPGGHKKEEHAAPPPPTPAPVVAPHEEDKEKKGILEKIKEKIPGYHSKSEEEKEKEKVKECD